MNAKIIKDACVLMAITLVSGLLLGFIHELTLEPIAAANYNIQQNAYKAVFADADSFEEYEAFDAAAATQIANDAGYTADAIEGAQTALDASGNPLGYVISLVSSEGYNGEIKLSIGVTLDGILNGYAITEIGETPGLGMKSQDAKFKDQFNNKATDQEFEVTKTGATADNEIDAISGATITSRAVTHAVNAGLAYFKSIVGGAN